MICDNHYSHCGEVWTVEGCDSFHNDRCPKCKNEVQPDSSTEYTEHGPKQHHHQEVQGPFMYRE